MRGIFNFALGLILIGQFTKADITPIQSCFPGFNFSKSTLTCRIATVEGEILYTFTLMKGKWLHVSDGKEAKSLNVITVRSLGARLSDVGAVDQSVQFVAKSFTGRYIATVDIPCNQTIFAVVGVSKQGQWPSEHIAGCSVK